MNDLADTPLYSIGAVARRTGLSEYTLRLWEQRYHAIAPARSNGRHRRYSERHVHRLWLLRSAQRSGRPIGDLARLSDAQIVALLRQAGPRALPEALVKHVRGCQRAIESLDSWTLTALLNRAGGQFGHVLTADALIAPVMEWVGERWANGDLPPEHGHLASGTIRTFLGAALAAQRPPAAAPTVVAGTLTGEQHELGTLTAAVVAAAEGWRVAYLGAGVPGRGMLATAAAHRARCLLIGSTNLLETAALDELQTVIRSAPPATAVLCGGAGAYLSRSKIEALGAAVIDLGSVADTLGEWLAEHADD